MRELDHLIKAVRERLSNEDRRLLRAVYCPPDPHQYDVLFDQLLEKLKNEVTHESNGRLRFT